ncbi:PQQ-binding-like beta-propeller repeat protein [Plantibacter sp. MCCC 1A11337]|uniref:outer membrane protein assembly factor BamB family protein n=1 Tax=Plantibacter sp. MCCC 1A11337 TaxID=2736644 RepID=UPI0015821F82|nr:PQQ-binding-like beta-propeller repeat protein [Plantibacter sp. MCCC 1A11337]NUJ89622.1 PQQ-binding-like beta-propeller repeat protein [Plantibacter sp. MCCC 1A11337]
MLRVQLCEACGTEIVDRRDGVCPSCGAMLPLRTGELSTVQTPAEAEAAAEPEPEDESESESTDDRPTPTDDGDLVETDAPHVETGAPAAEADRPPSPDVDTVEPTNPGTATSIAPSAVPTPVPDPESTNPAPTQASTPHPATAAADEPASASSAGEAPGEPAAPRALWHPDSLPSTVKRTPSRRRWFILGGFALAVVAAIVAVVLIVVAAVPHRVEGLALLRDLPTKPTVGTWELAHPLDGEVPAGDELYLNGYTASPNTALLVWSTDRPLDQTTLDDAPGETVVSLVNTANGHTLWDRRVTELSREFDRFDAPVVVSPPDAAAIVLSQGDLMVAVSRRDGHVVSTSQEHSSVEGIGFADFAAPAAFVPGLEGDLLISSTTADGTGTVGRYRSTDLTDPVWEVSGDAGERATTAGDKLFYDGAVYSLDDGSTIDWQGDLSWYYQQVGGDLVAIDYSGNDTTIRGVDDRTGAERWKATGALPVVLDASGLLVVADQSGERVRRLDPRSGEVEWRSGLTSTWDGAYTVGDTIMLGDGDGGYTGVGARDGEIRYEERDAEGSLVGYSDRTLLLTLDDTLVGIDATTGERSWSVDSAGDEYSFTAWGGSPLAVATVVAAGSDSAAVLGIGDADRD